MKTETGVHEERAKKSSVQEVKERVLETFKEERRHAATSAARGVALGISQTDKFDFAFPENLRDAQGRRPSDPEYDCRTVLVPQEQYLKFTDFERQFWDIKRTLFDTVVFFRKGMFYELFEADARIAQREFGMQFTTRASMVMVGFPASTFEQRSGELLAKGYRVARVDQAESSIALGKRIKAGGTSTIEGNVIRREVTEILTPGTLDSGRIVAVWEGQGRIFGMCVVECATHSLWWASWKDDERCGTLETNLIMAAPSEAVLSRGALSTVAHQMVKGRIPHRSLVHVRGDFWDADKARRAIEGAVDTTLAELGVLLADQAALWAIGGILAYLDELRLVTAVLSSVRLSSLSQLPAGGMAMDGGTLLNLEIFQGGAGSLLSLLNHTVTPQGSRLLRRWVGGPLCEPDAIAARLDAIDIIVTNPNDWSKVLRTDLKAIPDLERLASTCAAGICPPAKVSALVLGLSAAWRILVSRFRCNIALITDDIPSAWYLPENTGGALEHAAKVSAQSGAQLASVVGLVEEWSTSKDTVLEPRAGEDTETDRFRHELCEAHKQMDQLLAMAKDKIIDKDNIGADIAWKNVGKLRFLLEMDPSLRRRAEQSGYKLVSSTKKADRFSSPQIEKHVQILAGVEDLLASRHIWFCGEVQRRLSAVPDLVTELAAATAHLDCLLSLAHFTTLHPGQLCRPQVLPMAGKHSFLEATDLRHPISLKSSAMHVPNTVRLGGGSGPTCLLVTGPNMGGKSTLMRSVCLATVLAHIGVWVPATSFRLSVGEF